MLTAAAGVDDLVDGLALGADDYLPKPFRFAELVARTRALARRNGAPRPPVLTAGDVELDPSRRTVTRAGREIDLAPKELAVLEVLMAAGGAVVGPDELLEQGLGRGHRPVHEHGPHDRHDAAPQARGPAGGPHRARRRLPRVTLRLRLTALYTLLFGACGALLLGLSSWIVHRQVDRTLPAGYGERALDQLDAQYLLAGGGMLLVAVALGYVVAGQALSPLRKVTGLARRVTQERLDERIAMDGPRDELRDLADTVDGMLDRLAAAFDGQKRFVANASHELRTPLTIIRAEVEVALADPDASAAELRHMGEVVLEAADRTQALLDSLMVLARSQQALPRREPVDLACAARTAAAICEPEAAARHIDVRLDLEPGAVEGDPPLVERLVANLVENAVRHNERGGSVRVTTRPGLVRVENTGPGDRRRGRAPAGRAVRAPRPRLRRPGRRARPLDRSRGRRRARRRARAAPARRRWARRRGEVRSQLAVGQLARAEPFHLGGRERRRGERAVLVVRAEQVNDVVHALGQDRPVLGAAVVERGRHRLVARDQLGELLVGRR